MSKNTKEQNEHLKQVFERLSQFGLKINVEKRIFKAKNLKFLRHEKLFKILDNQHPQDNSDVSFSLIKYSRRCLPSVESVYLDFR